MELEKHQQQVVTAAAVIVGCALVAAAFFYSDRAVSADTQLTIQRSETKSQRVYGSVRAPFRVVEFSDYQCPFCARLHPEVKRLVDESDGQVAWEYRHLPLQNHPLAFPAAVLAECVASHKGNQAFWDFSDAIFLQQRTLSQALLEEEALRLGLSEEQIAACQVDPTISQLITTDAEAAAALGGRGTPFSVILNPDNSYRSVPGAVSYEQLQQLVDSYNE